MEEFKVRNRFDRERKQTEVVGESRVKRSLRDQVDVNAIVRKWQSTGVLQQVISQEPRYGDFSNVDDYKSAVDRVRAAEADFDALPAHIRQAVRNDPQVFLELALDPERRQEMVELGLGEVANYLHGPVEEPVPEPPPSEPSGEPEGEPPPPPAGG